MKAILLVSHGFYAQELRESVKMIAGEVENIYCVCLEPSDGPENFSAKLDKIKPQLDEYDRILVFADLFGGSPCNTTFQYFALDPKVDFVAGMNFSMVLNAVLIDNVTVESLINEGREAIVDVKAFTLAMMANDDDE